MIEQFDDVQWGKVLAEAWIDPDFKLRLEANPSEVLREFALREFGLEIDCSLDTLTIPEPPAGMFGERLSGAGGAAGTATATATACSQVSATASATATSGGNVSATACATATSGGNVSATATATATSGGN
jgi:hypothetical protein